MKIITLTLNVALDVHCYAECFKPFEENITKVISRDAGGKGINISRALCSAGVPNTALAVLGREGGDEFKKMLEDDGIDVSCVYVDGRIRENITVHTESAPETRISFCGPTVTDKLLDEVYFAINNMLDGDTVLTFTGSVPEGIGKKAVIDFLLKLKASGVKLVLDSRSLDKNDVLYVKPFLIKPNEYEIKEYTDVAVTDLGGAADAAKRLVAEGIDNVMISLGARGAVLCNADGCYLANAPKIRALSTVGAGDSSVAGFLAAYRDGCSAADILASAVAYGSAACLTGGTKPPKREDVLLLRENIRVEML